MKRVLIIRFSSIGDIVLTTPVIRSLKQAQPETEIHYLTKPAYQDLLLYNPYVDHIHLWDDSPRVLVQKLRKLRFDHVLDLHKNLRSLRVRWALRRPVSSFDKQNWAKWRMTRSAQSPQSLPHIVARYGESLKALDLGLDEKGLDLFLPPEKVQEAKVRLKEAGFDAPLAVVLGATHRTKRWIPAYFVQLLNQYQQAVLLIGGPDAREEADLIRSQLSVPVFDAVGKYKLLESAALMQQCPTVIAHDTGFMHIAAAFGQRVISLWGNTAPEMGMTPYRTAHEILEVKGLACRPCSKLGYDECPQGHFRCMQELKPERVLKVLEERK